MVLRVWLSTHQEEKDGDGSKHGSSEDKADCEWGAGVRHTEDVLRES